MKVLVVLIHWPTPSESKPYATDVLGVYVRSDTALEAGQAWKDDKPDTCWWSMMTTSLKA